MSRDEAWMRRPDRDCWIAFIYYGSLLSVLWVIVYGGADWITSLHNYRIRLHFDSELELPFVPAASIIYLSLFPMLWLSPFVLQTKERLKLFARSLAFLYVISGIGFLILPGKDVRQQIPSLGFMGQVSEFADWINLTYNYLPSLHVGMAVLCASIYARTAPPKIRVLLWAWAAAIGLSTLLTHQHYVADVAAGGALGFAIATRVFHRSFRIFHDIRHA